MRNPFGDTKFERRANGYFIVDGVEVAATLQCCHCGAHFVSVKGSKKVRGFCMNCYKVTCGKKTCDPCMPFEKKLNLFEKGLIKSL